MKDVVLIRNALINGSRYLAGARISVDDALAELLASLEIACIMTPIVPEVSAEAPKPVRRRSPRKKVTE